MSEDSKGIHHRRSFRLWCVCTLFMKHSYNDTVVGFYYKYYMTHNWISRVGLICIHAYSYRKSCISSHDEKFECLSMLLSLYRGPTNPLLRLLFNWTLKLLCIWAPHTKAQVVCTCSGCSSVGCGGAALQNATDLQVIRAAKYGLVGLLCC